MDSERQQIVVVGHGMVGHKFLEEAVAAGLHETHDITVIGEEPRVAYDRVHLSSYFDGVSADELCMVEPGFTETYGIECITGDQTVAIDPATQQVTTESGRTIAYDELVLATGSKPFVPPMPGHDRPGTFVYRTIEDLEAIAAMAREPWVRTGVVIGGGLLGLEAANALRLLGLDTHVIEMAPRLMPVQLDDGAAAMLRRHVEALDITVHTGVRTTQLAGDGSGAVCTVDREDGEPIPADLVVFSAGIRPRDELARDADLAVGERGGVVVDAALYTSDPHISAIGEVACVEGRCLGLVAPGYDMARVVAKRLAGDAGASFTTPDLSAKLKLLGVDVASFGDPFAEGPDVDVLVWNDSTAGVHKRLVRTVDGPLLGGMLVGEAGDYQTLRLMALGEIPTPDDLTAFVAPTADRPAAIGLPDSAPVCSCENVTAGDLRGAISGGCRSIGDLKGATAAGTGCGGCLPMVGNLLKDELLAAGEYVSDAMCEHFDMSRQSLYDLIRVHRYTSWTAVVTAHGTGGGCEICRPTVASILASLSNGYVLDGEQAALQDTNDHALANMQRDGTYSVVPRVPGGEITPDQLIALGQIAKDFGLYTKITGGQRVDLFGARLEELPAIWQRVIDAGMESGHAYGKAVRTVKSCVGQTWCRYGVQDSVSMAIRIEERYRGLRAPHKLKFAVSGCTRECAEAQSKDVGVIATERGWNLYVAGNGGKKPRHGDLLATDLDDEGLIQAIDRFLGYYIRTADRLERTSTWFDKLEGGMDHVRAVVLEDSLGIADELEADMADHVDSYECEWKATLADPARLRRFVSYVNAPDAGDPEIVMVEERGQRRPARPDELQVQVLEQEVAIR